ncbi:MAG TPA: hypothetical protein VKA61_09465, partial [Sphingomicrobium sp.]|nr:hypothetical protein [Sphingomicrobium sp.]
MAWLTRPMRPLSDTGLSDGTVATGAAFVLLAMPLFNFLTYNRYPVFTVEVALIILLLLSSAMVFGFLYRIAPLVGRALLEPMPLLAVLITFTMRFSLLSLVALVPFFVLVSRRSVLPFAGIGALIATGAVAAGIGRGNAPSLVQRTDAPAAAISKADP